MSDEQEEQTDTNAETPAAEGNEADDTAPAAEGSDDASEGGDEDDAKADEADTDDSGDDEGDDDDKKDDDDDDEKPKKPKKIKINYEASLARNEAVSYFEAIVGGLRSGRLEFRQEGDTLVLSPPDHLEIEVKASLKGDKAKVVFEIEWSDENRPLEILN